MENILKSKKWKNYLEKHKFEEKEYLEMYFETYKYVQIFKVQDYYFTFGVFKGYLNLSSVKRNIA